MRTSYLYLIVGIVVPSARAQQPPPPNFLNINPSWSPDGRQLVYESDRHDRGALYIINTDGTGERRLTFTGADDTHPSWSPDGSRIVFDSDRDGVWNLHSIRPDGTDERRLTHPATATRPAFARHPAWSPDGKRIAFDSGRDSITHIWVMNADGSGAARVTGPPGGGHPAWTPDGRIVFGAARSGNSDLWTTTIDGSDTRLLVAHPMQKRSPSLSPDGRRVVFFAENEGKYRLFRL